MKKLEAKNKALLWFATPEENRDPPTQRKLARKLGVNEMTIVVWRKKWAEERTDQTEADELARQIKMMDEAVFGAATSGNKVAKMAELWYRRHGLLVDKSISLQKRVVELSEDDREFIRGEARHRDAEFNRGRNREGALLPESSLLPVEVREGEGQSTGDNPV